MTAYPKILYFFVERTKKTKCMTSENIYCIFTQKRINSVCGHKEKANVKKTYPQICQPNCCKNAIHRLAIEYQRSAEWYSPYNVLEKMLKEHKECNNETLSVKWIVRSKKEPNTL